MYHIRIIFQGVGGVYFLWRIAFLYLLTVGGSGVSVTVYQAYEGLPYAMGGCSGLNKRSSLTMRSAVPLPSLLLTCLNVYYGLRLCGGLNVSVVDYVDSYVTKRDIVSLYQVPNA